MFGFQCGWLSLMGGARAAGAPPVLAGDSAASFARRPRGDLDEREHETVGRGSVVAGVVDDDAKLWFGDVNGDGTADVVVQGAPGTSSAGWIFVGRSSGAAFSVWSWVSGMRQLQDFSNTWVADMDGDGRVDVTTQAAASGHFGPIQTALSDGASFGSWSWPW